MQNYSEKRFYKRAVSITVIACLVLQAVCATVSYIYAYSIDGTVSDGSVWTVINSALEFLGQISVFSGYGIIGYLVFLYGQRKGGEWLIALAAGYFLIYFLIFFIGDVSFALGASALTAIILVGAYLYWTKSCHGISLIVFGSMLIPYIGATALEIANGAFVVEQLLIEIFLNLGINILFITVAARICNYFRTKAISGDGSADISIGGRILPNGNPVLKAFFVINIGYAIVFLIPTVIETVYELNDYGLPTDANEWYTLLSPYFLSAVNFVLGYAVMLLIATRLEKAFVEETGE